MPFLNSEFQSKLQDELGKIVKEQDLTEHQQLINKLAEQLKVDPLTYTAALISYIYESQNSTISKSTINRQEKQPKPVSSEMRMLWYRLEVGLKHQVAVTMLKRIMVDESGVEERLIGRVNIYDNYTLIQLPNGMPSELLRHLKTVTFNSHQLNIKRLKNRPNRKSKSGKYKPKNKSFSKKNGDLVNSENTSNLSSDASLGSDKRVASHLFAKS